MKSLKFKPELVEQILERTKTTFKIIKFKLTIKLIIWHGVVLVLSWEFWRYLSYLFNSSKPDFELAGVINFIILSSVLALGLMLFRKKWHTLSFGATHGLFYLVYFGFNTLNLLGVAILAGLLFFSRFSINSELNERLKVNSRTIGPRVEGGEIEKQNIISQIAGETFREINTFLKPYFQFAPPLLAFGLFLVLWGLSWFFIWLSVLVGMLIFWILKKTKMVIIKEKDVKAEMLVI